MAHFDVQGRLEARDCNDAKTRGRLAQTQFNNNVKEVVSPRVYTCYGVRMAIRHLGPHHRAHRGNLITIDRALLAGRSE